MARGVGGGGSYSREAIKRGKAIILGNTVYNNFVNHFYSVCGHTSSVIGTFGLCCFLLMFVLISLH